jgi:hypothetical protein
MFKHFLRTLALLLSTEILHSQNALKSPDEFLPHRNGMEFTEHYQLVDYYRHVAANSDRVKLVEFGRTNQGRPQILAIVSSPENMRRIEDLRLNNLRNAGLANGASDNAKPIAFVWLGFSVHGNESAGSEASLPVLYELVNPANRQAAEWLQNTVVLIEPSVNPDGYNRYVQWYKNNSPHHLDPTPAAREHQEPWPGGRTNHYYFDLNRDWAWATQTETKNRLKIYNEWMPHVVADLHEQHYNDPYYFAPAAQPYHRFLTKFQWDFQVEIGKNHAKYFDENGWLYFTKEVFDLFYPSYGDTYPCYNGAIGMTYEQGGSGRAGRGIVMENGDTLTLADRVAHHKTTALSTVEVSSKNAARLVQNFADYFKKSQNDPPGQYKSFIVKGSNPPHKIKTFAALLDQHGIRYGKAGKATTAVTAYDYTTSNETKINIADNDLIISAFQPKGLLAQVLLEPTAELVDSLTYDITAWALPYAHGLEAYATKTRIDPGQDYDWRAKPVAPSGSTPYAYLAIWNSTQSASFLGDLLKNGVTARYAEKRFDIGGKSYAPGTLVITRADNRKNPDFDKVVRAASTKFEYELTSVESGFVTSGHDFGSESMRLIIAPRILVLSGEKTWSNEFGQVWFFFDREINYPATIINADQLNRVDLDDFNLLVLPEGSYGFDDGAIERIGNWVSGGGRLIAIGYANASLEDKKGFSLSRYAKATDKDEAQRQSDQEALDARKDVYHDRVRSSLSNQIPGAIVRAKMDTSHPLAFGIKDYYFSLKTNDLRYDLLKNAWNVGRLGDDLKVSGFIGANLKSKLKNSLAFAVQEKGRGQVIYLIDNPLFRSFWEEGKLLFSNAVFLVH